MALLCMPAQVIHANLIHIAMLVTEDAARKVESLLSTNGLLTAERNNHVHFNPNPQRASCRPIQPEFQTERRDELQGMDCQGGETANGVRNRRSRTPRGRGR